jgi:hypothetical protein
MSVTVVRTTTTFPARVGAGLIELIVPGHFAAGGFLLMPFEHARGLFPQLHLLRPRGRRIVAVFAAGEAPSLPMTVGHWSASRPYREARGFMDLSYAVSQSTDVAPMRALPRYPLVVRYPRDGGEPEIIVHEEEKAAWHQMLADFSRRKIVDLLGVYGRGLRRLEEERQRNPEGQCPPNRNPTSRRIKPTAMNEAISKVGGRYFSSQSVRHLSWNTTGQR